VGRARVHTEDVVARVERARVPGQEVLGLLPIADADVACVHHRDLAPGEVLHDRAQGAGEGRPRVGDLDADEGVLPRPVAAVVGVDTHCKVADCRHHDVARGVVVVLAALRDRVLGVYRRLQPVVTGYCRRPGDRDLRGRAGLQAGEPGRLFEHRL